MKTFYQNIEQVLSLLDKEGQDFLYSAVSTKSFYKHELLLQAGQVCRYTFFVEEGCLRKYSLKEGIEVTCEFIFPGEMAVSLGSFLHQRHSNECIQAIDTCKVRLIPYGVFKYMGENYKEFAQIDFLILQEYCLWLENRLHSMQFHTAKERYEHLLKT